MAGRILCISNRVCGTDVSQPADRRLVPQRGHIDCISWPAWLVPFQLRPTDGKANYAWISVFRIRYCEQPLALDKLDIPLLGSRPAIGVLRGQLRSAGEPVAARETEQRREPERRSQADLKWTIFRRRPVTADVYAIKYRCQYLMQIDV